MLCYLTNTTPKHSPTLGLKPRFETDWHGQFWPTSPSVCTLCSLKFRHNHLLQAPFIYSLPPQGLCMYCFLYLDYFSIPSAWASPPWRSPLVFLADQTLHIYSQGIMFYLSFALAMFVILTAFVWLFVCLLPTRRQPPWGLLKHMASLLRLLSLPETIASAPWLTSSPARLCSSVNFSVDPPLLVLLKFALLPQPHPFTLLSLPPHALTTF